MKYFVIERKPTEKNMRNAANKARTDVATILLDNGYQAIDIIIDFRSKKSIIKKIMLQFENYKIWKQKLSFLKTGDELLIQFPMMSSNIFLSRLLKNLGKRGIKIILLIHDLEKLRYVNSDDLSLKHRIRLTVEETTILESAHKIIVHNDKMKDYLLQQGFDEDKLVCLEIFDYLLKDTFTIQEKSLTNQVIIAGNLDPSKVAYLKDIGGVKNVTFQLFGANYQPTDAKNINYNGSFLPEELIEHLVGSFGLVWDGESIATCSGVYGNYLKFNNPHKTSLYLASGFPVIVWKEAAIADFITKNHLGIVVSSLTDIENRLLQISEEDYQKMVINVRGISERLRQGYYLLSAIDRATR